MTVPGVGPITARLAKREAVIKHRNNGGGTAVLLEAMREADVRHIVFSSTCALQA